MKSETRPVNRLAKETSPYLLQHQHNPVDWYPWGEAALTRAREEEKLILLSVGYSACHWCHVMERESFENDEIAAIMNEHFVSIKVDREERPDIDDIYMAATVAMNRGQGGWPMTVFLTPDLEPVFAGTYYPPEDRYGRPGFPRLLHAVASAWDQDRDNVALRAREFASQLSNSRSSSEQSEIGGDELRMAARQFADQFDARYGGFGSAPKFPPSVVIMLLLRLYHRFGDDHLLAMALKTLDGMAYGGMYDHVGGGFCRYSTDERWLVPHFEKMLYDNALLSKAYLEAFQVTRKMEYHRVAAETLDYVLRDMTSPEGGFFSSTDADSEGVEGKFFVWSAAEIDPLFTESDAALVRYYYDISEGGNWESTNIPNTPNTPDVVANRFGMTADEIRDRMSQARQTLFEAREKRIKPHLDDKILTAWNGLMIGAFAEGYRILRDRRYLVAATDAADFLLANLCAEDGRLLRTHRNGQSHLNAYLEDYAYLAEGLIDLYESGGKRHYFDWARRLLEIIVDDFTDAESGAFFHTGATHERLLFRYREGTDGATPAPNAVAASAMARLAGHLGDSTWLDHASRAINAYGGNVRQYPRAFAKSLIVTDWMLDSPVQLAFVGSANSERLEEMLRVAGTIFLPHRVQAISDLTEIGGLPLLEGKGMPTGDAALYVCQNFMCSVPVTDVDQLERTLRSLGANQT